MSGFTGIGIQTTTVTNETSAGADDASQLAPLGFELTVPDGNNGFQTWVYVKTEDALVTGNVVIRKSGTSSYTVVKNPGNADIGAIRVVGVCQHAIGDNGYGFVLKKGIGTLMKDNAALGSADTSLICSDAGTSYAGMVCADSGGGTSDVFAMNMAAVSGSSGGETFTARINCIG